jgi:alcohol dehydrogenase class IV
MILTGNWRIPTEILAGPGRISELAGRARDLGVKRALVVTDPGVAALPFMPGIIAGLEAAGIAVAVFKDVHPDPVAVQWRRQRAGLRQVDRAGCGDGPAALGF